MSDAAQTPSAFTGHVIHAQPFSTSPRYQTPLYRKWTALRKSAPDTTPDWAEFQAQANRPKPPAEPRGRGRPAGKGLSARGQKLVELRPYGFCTPIEPAGSGIALLARTKARI